MQSANALTCQNSNPMLDRVSLDFVEMAMSKNAEGSTEQEKKVSTPNYEILGKFYLGKPYDLTNGKLEDQFLLYDSKDLTTHALCVGMTGSGKTGLCISLLEEAAIDRIPAICIDPKGDLGNLLLTFPNLEASDFEKWIDPGEAQRKDKSINILAKDTAELWRNGLADWNQTPDRIQKFRDSVDITIYTPGSKTGVPLTVLKGFAAPPPELQNDDDAFRALVSSSASGLLVLLGIESDPLTSREHILLSNILDKAWRDGKSLDMPELIRQIQSPPIERVGVLDLESFLPAAQRAKIAMSLNNLLASPAFAGWLEGESLDIQRLLYTADGKPRLSILSISHLSDTERMFFVTMLLNELISWMRTQPGTSSLRALLYMDEVFGYFPPIAQPPSKLPMLTLLKQARAFGLGVCLATQNPVDLDYKGLGNIGTWFLGRLQTSRDKERVLDGLEGASLQQGSAFDRKEMDRMLSSMGNRVFLMNNVHDDGPTIFQTRWALSYLRGPLSRSQIQELMADKRKNISASPSPIASSDNHSNRNANNPSMQTGDIGGKRPIVPAGISEWFASMTEAPKTGTALLYRPYLMAEVSMHFVRATSQVDYWRDKTLTIAGSTSEDCQSWENAEDLKLTDLELTDQPEDGLNYAILANELSSPKFYQTMEKSLSDYLFRNQQIKIFTSKALKRSSRPEQSEDEARIELSQVSREIRDERIDSMKSKYATKLESIQKRIHTAEQRLEKEKEQSSRQRLDSVLNIGGSILGALLGNKRNAKSTISAASKVAKGWSKTSSESSDVERATESLEKLLEEFRNVEQECEADMARIADEFSAENMRLEEVDIPLRKSDTRVKQFGLLWIPFQVDDRGIEKRLA